MQGRILKWSKDPTVTDRRGRLVVTKGSAPGSLFVRVINDDGGDVLFFVAGGLELTLVDMPAEAVPENLRDRARPKHRSHLVTVPGASWFYGRDGHELGFLPDATAGAFSIAAAVERPRKGSPFKTTKGS